MQVCFFFAYIALLLFVAFDWFQAHYVNSEGAKLEAVFEEDKLEVVNSIDYHVQTDFCNIERRLDTSLSTEEFRKKYAGKKPLIIVHTIDENRNERFKNLTSFNNILKNYGDLKIVLSTANSYTKLKRTTTVNEYLNQYMNTTTLSDQAIDVFYWFGDNYKTLRKLTDQFRINNYAGPKYNTPSFGVGGKLSGVPFHFHGGGFSEVMHGRKRWWLYKDKIQFNGNETQLQWLHKFYPKVTNNKNIVPTTSQPLHSEMLECTISFGEALYFPSQWYHATLNLDKYTAFVSTFTDGESKASYGDDRWGEL